MTEPNVQTEPVAVTLPAKPPTLSKVSSEARALSSGTVAGLIHRSHYAIIDAAQETFVAFIDRMDAAAGRPVFACWQDAWAAFRLNDQAYAVMLAEIPPPLVETVR